MTREKSWCPYQLTEGSPSGLFEKDWIAMVRTKGEPILSDAGLTVPDEKPFYVKGESLAWSVGGKPGAGHCCRSIQICFVPIFNLTICIQLFFKRDRRDAKCAFSRS